MVAAVAAQGGGVAWALPGSPVDPATTVLVTRGQSPTMIAGPLAAAAPSGAAAPVGSAWTDDATADGGFADVGSPPVPEHRPLAPPRTTPPPVTVDPWTLFPGATVPSDVTTAPRDLASAPLGTVALADPPVPVLAAPASEPLTGEPAPAAASRLAILPATR